MISTKVHPVSLSCSEKFIAHVAKDSRIIHVFAL